MDTIKNASKRSSWIEVGAVTAAYVLIVFVLCPGNALIGFPVHRDDFSNLAFNFHSLGGFFASGHPPRPVSYLGLTLLSVAGLPAYYLCLQALTILYAFLSLTLLRRLLGTRRMPLLFAFLVAAGALSFENVVEYSKYTGLITNLLSGVFAASAMLVMASERARPAGEPFLRAPAMGAVWIFCALSFWSKEDFVLPAVLMAVYFAWEAKWTGGSWQARWLVLAGGVVLLAALLSVYNRLGDSGFTQAKTGPYRADFSPSSILHTAGFYLFMTRVAGLAAVLQVSMLVWNLLAPAPVAWTRLLLVQILIGLLILPYCFLPNHTAVYYGFNWTVWQIGAALTLLASLSGRTAVRWAVAGIAIGCVAIGNPERRSIAAWYGDAGQVNRNVVAVLRTNAEALRPFKAVVVEGAPFVGPFASDGSFLSMRYGLDHDWMIRVPKDSEYFRTTLQLLGTGTQGRTRTVAMEDEPRPAGVPVLKLAPNGTGTLLLPGAPLKASGNIRVDKMIPDTTTAGVKFQVQANGQSAIGLTGVNFQPGAIISFDGRELSTTFGNPGFITAFVPDALISRAGAIKVQVLNPNGDASNEVVFHVILK